MSEQDKKEDNLRYYKSFASPPADATKKIKGGRLAGMTDINPQWRLEALTELFGPIGSGWRYQVTGHDKHELDGQVALFVHVALYIGEFSDLSCTDPDATLDDIEGIWSAAIHGTGGSMLVAHEKGNLRLNDEAWKMAITDALSVCCKQLGIGADVYRGIYDSKYSNAPKEGERPGARPKEEDTYTSDVIASIVKKIQECKTTDELRKVAPKKVDVSQEVWNQFAPAIAAKVKELNPIE